MLTIERCTAAAAAAAALIACVRGGRQNSSAGSHSYAREAEQQL